MNLRPIHDAIAALHAMASTSGTPTALVPLDALLAELPLYRAEIPGLTRGRAFDYLRQRAGAALPEPASPKERLSGFLYVYPYEGQVWGCILVDQNDIIERRRFSAAHELGHYLLHFLPLMQQRLQRGDHVFLSEGFLYAQTKDDPDNDAQTGPATILVQDATGAALDAIQLGTPEAEAEANRFAAELLMPEATCRALWSRPGLQTPRRLAQELLVSPAAMKVRLNSLGLGLLS